MKRAPGPVQVMVVAWLVVPLGSDILPAEELLIVGPV